MPAAGHIGGVSPAAIRWLGLWGLLCLGALAIYNASYTATRDLLVRRLQVEPAARLIQLTLPAGLEVQVAGDGIRTPALEVVVRRGCDGMEAWILMATALAVFPLPWRRRWRSLVLGTLLIYLLNLTRIVTLFHVALWRPDWLETAHGLIWQTLIVVAAALFVLLATQPPDAAKIPPGGLP